MGLWSGKVDIKQVKLKPNLLQRYKIPVRIVYSALQGLSLQIPWKSIFTSPLVITIESVVVLCNFAEGSLPRDVRREDVVKMINSTIRQAGQDLLEKSKEKQKQAREDGGVMGKLTYKILDNLYLSIKNIHVRF